MGYVQPGRAVGQVIETARLTLTPWKETDRAAFLAMTADPEVMHDYAAPWDSHEANQRFDRHMAAFAQDGFGKWALRCKGDDAWLGYCGVSPIWPDLAIAPGLEVGWRMTRGVWGQGFATEAARAALRDIFQRTRADEVACFTLTGNERSLAVMRRLGLRRTPDRDFLYEDGRSAVMHVADREVWT